MSIQSPLNVPTGRMRSGPSAGGKGPWRRAEFRWWFFIGRLMSLAGSAMTPVALSFAVLHASGRGGDLAIVLAVNSLTLLVFLLLGGALGDRLPRGPLLVAANLAAAASQGAVAVLLLTATTNCGRSSHWKRPTAAPRR